MTDAKRLRERYAEDPEYRQRRLASNATWAQGNRDKINGRRRSRYATDTEYRTNLLTRNRKRGRQKLCRSHGITVQDFDAMLAGQKGACGICHRRLRGTPCIDHCHFTGWVRALLCNGCNSGLGHFGDNPAFMFQAGFYMQAWVQYLIECFSEEENTMSSIKHHSNESDAANLIRDAIMKELQQPFGVLSGPPTDCLQEVARALVDKAKERDVAAIKEVFDRAGGKPPAHGRGHIPSVLNVSWQNPLVEPKPPRSKPLTTRRGSRASVAKDQARGRAVG
jgi:recombination endonuclease VII